MPSTGIINATNVKLYVGDVLVAHCTNAQMSISVEMMGATTKDSAGWEESIPGRKSWSMSGDFFYTNLISSVEFNDFYAAIANKTKLTVSFTTRTVGDDQYGGSCYVESAELSAGVEDNASYSITLKGTGALSKTSYTSGS